jgi:hypothetical protein
MDSLMLQSMEAAFFPMGDPKHVLEIEETID